MEKQKKEYDTINCKIDKSVSDMLKSFVEETGLSKTVTVEKALKQYIQKYKQTGKI